MKYAYTHVECGPCIMDLLEENDDLSMDHYSSISTEESEQDEVIEDDQMHWFDRNKKFGMVFHTETLKDISFAQENFGDRLLAGLCAKGTVDLS